MGVPSQPARDLEFELALYESVVWRDPDNLEALTALGEAYTHAREYAKGLEVDQKLVKLRPQDPLVHYNLACSLSLLEQADPAFAALERAVSLGYADLAQMDRDPDLEGLRRDPRYAALREGLRKQPAVPRRPASA